MKLENIDKVKQRAKKVKTLNNEDVWKNLIEAFDGKKIVLI